MRGGGGRGGCFDVTIYNRLLVAKTQRAHSSAVFWNERRVPYRSRGISKLMFHCSVSTAVIAASLFTSRHPFLPSPHPHIDDDIKIKENHRPSLLLAFIIKEKMRKDERRRRRRKGGACMNEWLRNPNSLRRVITAVFCVSPLPVTHLRLSSSSKWCRLRHTCIPTSWHT